MKVIIGKYIEKDSQVHRLDPRCKLLCLFLYTISIFFVSTNFEYVIPFSFFLTSALFSRIPVKFYLKGLRAIFFLLAFAAIVQFIYYGFYSALFIFLRLTLILLAAEVFTFTTKPSEFTYAVEDFLRFMGFSRRSAQEFAMVMNIAVRFAPMLIEELDRITKAQISRGAPFDSKKLSERFKALMAVIVPVMSSAVRKAEELSVAMEARRYSPELKRTRYVKIEWRTKETIVLLFAVFVFVLVVKV